MRPLRHGQLRSDCDPGPPRPLRKVRVWTLCHCPSNAPTPALVILISFPQVRLLRLSNQQHVRVAERRTGSQCNAQPVASHPFVSCDSWVFCFVGSLCPPANGGTGGRSVLCTLCACRKWSISGSGSRPTLSVPRSTATPCPSSLALCTLPSTTSASTTVR